MTLHRFSPHIYSPYLHNAKLFQSKMLLKVIYKKTYQYRRGRIYCLSIKLVIDFLAVFDLTAPAQVIK